MIRMVNPSGGVAFVAEDRVSHYVAEGFKPFALPFEIPDMSKEEEKRATEVIKNADLKTVNAKINEAISVGTKKATKRTKK